MTEKREGRQNTFVQRALTFTGLSDICFPARVTAAAAAAHFSAVFFQLSQSTNCYMQYVPNHAQRRGLWVGAARHQVLALNQEETPDPGGNASLTG